MKSNIYVTKTPIRYSKAPLRPTHHHPKLPTESFIAVCGTFFAKIA